MFNEVFWFMYFAHLGEVLLPLGACSTGLFIFTWLFACTEGAEIRGLKQTIWVASLILMVGILYPKPSTWYAGAGYYVAEQVEITDTLVQLKQVIDAHIEELKPESE